MMNFIFNLEGLKTMSLQVNWGLKLGSMRMKIMLEGINYSHTAKDTVFQSYVIFKYGVPKREQAREPVYSFTEVPVLFSNIDHFH